MTRNKGVREKRYTRVVWRVRRMTESQNAAPDTHRLSELERQVAACRRR